MLPRRNKYHAVRTNGFDSKAEAAWAQNLKNRQMAGEISDLTFQHKVELCPGVTWKVDFSYTERGHTVFSEVKGKETADYRVKKKLWKAFGKHRLIIVKNGKEVEVIPPGPYEAIKVEREEK